jgi:hypothetical protein
LHGIICVIFCNPFSFLSHMNDMLSTLNILILCLVPACIVWLSLIIHKSSFISCWIHPWSCYECMLLSSSFYTYQGIKDYVYASGFDLSC